MPVLLTVMPVRENSFMTPYESALSKKLSQAIELSSSLTKWANATGNDFPPEESILQALIQHIQFANRQFEEQWQRYWELCEKRRQLAHESEDGIKPINERLWDDIGYQFKGGTVANDLIKILYLKIHRLQLPVFPANRRKPVLYKDLRLHEDSYALLGQYFSWLLDLLQIVDFIPVNPSYCLKEFREQARQFNVLTQEVTQEAEILRTIQLTQSHLYKQLNQVMNTVRGRLLTYKRDTKRVMK
ncbi:hypothetical protein GO755_04280 [Spirosoma sp. HMF4905]|uniref:Uncharacterized protein n=1 Tax=Spirosoma arboris TaxID=2682092 RepID=A0A7K1S5Z7_9BACT|nr:hypothetical protein [Spirosoma arboris]MVM29239.1 hypothetical protein [Spirosoma arboris]